MRTRIENKQFSEERALYNIIDTDVVNVTFAGIEDGESVLKEIRNCSVSHCNFSSDLLCFEVLFPSLYFQCAAIPYSAILCISLVLI